MAYADQQMSGNRITAIVIVALIHVALGYALVTGLAYEAAKKVITRVTTINIEEEVKKEELPPPPPPKPMNLPPPPKIITPVVVPQTLATPQPVYTPEPQPTVAPIVPPKVEPRFTPKSAVPKGNPGNWATTNDYPSRALREERAGTTGFRVTIGPDGKVTDCQVTSSSGHADLDEATCSNIRRRARFTPATDGEGQPTTGSYSSRVRWVIPKD